MSGIKSEMRSAARLNERLEFLISCEAPEDGGERHRALLRCLEYAIESELSPAQRNILRMYYMDGIKIPKIAAKLGVNKSSVCRSLQSSRRKLHESLKYSVMLLNTPTED